MATEYAGIYRRLVAIGRYKPPPVANTFKRGSHISPQLLALLFKPQSEAYLGSVTGRRGTSQKDPYRAYVNKKRAAQDEHRALGDTTVIPPRTKYTGRRGVINWKRAPKVVCSVS